MKLAFVLLAACGSSSHGTPDAGVDGLPGAAVTVYAPYPSQTAAVTPGATVEFYDATGTLLDRETTGADGYASGEVSDGGTVTVVPPAGGAASFEWVGVAPGDRLATAAAVPPISGDHPINVTLARDGDDVVDYVVMGTGMYALQTMPPASGPITLSGRQYADAPPTADLVGIALHSDMHPRYAISRGVALDAPTLDLTNVTWMPAVTSDRTLDNIAADNSFINCSERQTSKGLLVWSEDWYTNFRATSYTMHAESPGLIGDHASLFCSYGAENVPAYLLAYNTPPATIDLSALAPTATQVATTANAVTWQAAGPASAATGVLLTFQAGDASWMVIMPSDQRAYHPRTTGPVSNPVVMFYGGNDPAGYAGLRTDPLVFSPAVYGKTDPPTPGVYRLTVD